MLSEVGEVISWADGSLNSELKVIESLSREARSQGKIHKIILMVDVGDLREGVMPEDTLGIVDKILQLPCIEFEGIGTNLGCYGGVLASFENTKVLVELAKSIEDKFKIKIHTLSGGNSSALSMLIRGQLASGINQFRIGDGILLGKDPSNLEPLPGTFVDAFELKTQVIGVRTLMSINMTEKSYIS